MTASEKEEIMNRASPDINVAKDRMSDAFTKLYSAGLYADADQLLRMIYRLERFQNKYNPYSIYCVIKRKRG